MDILDSKLKKKVKKIIKIKSKKTILAYGNYLLAKYESKNKKYEKELII